LKRIRYKNHYLKRGDKPDDRHVQREIRSHERNAEV
jgi:hypothetical protein